MTPALPRGLSGTQVSKALQPGGFEHVSARGSHAKYRADGRTAIVPIHPNLAPGTLRSIPRQADWSIDELLKCL
ncbi:type II toxin-antitoxin system HicA family toxin [Streptomyces pathocidini]|uniref:Type II toxin-antitoxin system HicA family toxin n=1 Tax=Streptomyces pathocidini TaxID=1650571 RepID=A0ABW7UXN2_9ACTN|nr:type II toxin-antitoxin system HicA family toxin [Streptomyces pathocidini]